MCIVRERAGLKGPKVLGLFYKRATLRVCVSRSHTGPDKHVHVLTFFRVPAPLGCCFSESCQPLSQANRSQWGGEEGEGEGEAQRADGHSSCADPASVWTDRQPCAALTRGGGTDVG